MLNIVMTVHHQDGRDQRVVVKPINQVAFEREFKRSFAEAFNGAPAFEHIYWVAWHAARAGVEFDAWLDTVDGIDFGETVPVDPTNPAASAGE